MLSGSLWRGMLRFALPLAASSILQQLFNSADIAIVGQFAGSDALAAVSSNGPIINLLINIFVGMSIGTNVVIARFIGCGDKRRISDAVHTSIVFALMAGVFIAIFGFFVSRPMLRLMSTPPEIIDLSTTYLRIYFLGMPALMLYNFSAAILRSRGDTKRPLIALTISGVINVVLNLFFVIGLKMSVAGVAIATVISQAVSAGLLILFLTRETGALRLVPKKLRLDKRILADIARIGLPSGLQGMVFSLSNVCVQSSMNSLGATVVAASGAALNFEIFTYFMINGFENAAVTFTGQNYGAGNLSRCSAVAYRALALGAIFTGAMCAIFIAFGSVCIRAYTSDPAVIEIALKRVRLVLSFQLANLVLQIFSGCMRGLGHSLAPAVISVAGICGVRILYVLTVFPKSPTFDTLMLVYPLSWVLTAAAVLCAYYIVRRKAYSLPADK